MWKNLFILSLCIVVLFVFSAPITPVNAGDKGKNINWRIAGTIVQFIDISMPALGPPIYVGPHSMINLSAKGSPGPAQITLLSMSGPVHPGGKTYTCPDEYPIGPLYFVKNDFVAIFPDQSLLFATLDIDDIDGINHLCFGTAGSDFGVAMDITGGTGRFEGALGDFTATGNGYFINPGISDNTLVGENGMVTGTIDLP